MVSNFINFLNSIRQTIILIIGTWLPWENYEETKCSVTCVSQPQKRVRQRLSRTAQNPPAEKQYTIDNTAYVDTCRTLKCPGKLLQSTTNFSPHIFTIVRNQFTFGIIHTLQIPLTIKARSINVDVALHSHIYNRIYSTNVVVVCRKIFRNVKSYVISILNAKDFLNTEMECGVILPLRLIVQQIVISHGI